MRKKIWMIVALVGGYIFCQALADIGATKLVQMGKIVLPGGSIVFALTFTIRDMIHKRLGREWARAAIVMAAVFNIFMAAFLYWIAKLPVGYGNVEQAEAFSNLFMLVPAIVFGSIVAEVISETVDTEVYHAIADRFVGPWQFLRVVISNAVSLPLDSVIFASLAFVLLPPLFGAEAASWSIVPSIVGGQVVFKALVTLVSMPGIYLVKDQITENELLDATYLDAMKEDYASMGIAKAGDEV